MPRGSSYSVSDASRRKAITWRGKLKMTIVKTIMGGCWLEQINGRYLPDECQSVTPLYANSMTNQLFYPASPSLTRNIFPDMFPLLNWNPIWLAPLKRIYSKFSTMPRVWANQKLLIILSTFSASYRRFVGSLTPETIFRETCQKHLLLTHRAVNYSTQVWLSLGKKLRLEPRPLPRITLNSNFNKKYHERKNDE
jgi:hypothetical protein